MSKPSKEWLAKLYQGAADLKLDVHAIRSIVGMDADRLNNGGVEEVINLILAEGDEPEWLLQQMCEKAGVLYCYYCEKPMLEVQVRQRVLTTYEVQFSYSPPKYVAQPGHDPTDDEPEYECGECGEQIEDQDEEDQFKKNAGLT